MWLDKLKTCLTNAFPAADIEIGPYQGKWDHLDVKISCPSFQGKSTLERHRLVMNAATPVLNEGLHAVQISTRIKEPI